MFEQAIAQQIVQDRGFILVEEGYSGSSSLPNRRPLWRHWHWPSVKVGSVWI